MEDPADQLASGKADHGAARPTHSEATERTDRFIVASSSRASISAQSEGAAFALV